MDEMLQLAAATAGSAGFALLFNIRGRKLLVAVFGGFFSWGVYLAAGHVCSNEYLCGFLASVLLTVYAECMARVYKTPVTVFLVSGAIPLIPGAALYRAMNCLMWKDWVGFLEEGGYTLLFATGMAAGITLSTVIVRSLWSCFRQERRV